MLIKSGKAVLFQAALLALLIASASAQSNGRKPVLLVRDSSEFKDLLVEEIIIAVREAGLVLTIEDSFDMLKKAKLENCSGLIVINTGMAGRMKKAVREMLENPGNLPRTVVVTTYGNPATSKDVYPDHPRVDGITSPSLSDAGSIRSLAREIVGALIS